MNGQEREQIIKNNTYCLSVNEDVLNRQAAAGADMNGAFLKQIFVNMAEMFVDS